MHQGDVVKATPTKELDVPPIEETKEDKVETY